MPSFELVALIATNLLVATSAVGQTGDSQGSDWYAEYRDLATVGDYRMLAKDRNGITHEASSQSIVTASGSRCRVVTLVCEFALPKRDIRQWVLQRRIRVGTVDLGMIKARVIIDEDEEQELLGIQP